MRKILVICLIVLLAAATGVYAADKGFPKRDITNVVVWSAGNPGGPEAAMRILVIGTLDGSAGYAVALRAVDVGEPGAFDTVRFGLYHGTAPWPDPGTLMYDSAGDFHHDVNSRTNLDAGNFQSWVDAPTS